jgi:hypothetical protein
MRGFLFKKQQARLHVFEKQKTNKSFAFGFLIID